MSLPAYGKYKITGMPWLPAVPDHWALSRADSLIDTTGDQVDADALNGVEVFHYSIPVVQETGDGQFEDGTEILSNKLVVSEACVLISKLNPRKGTVCIGTPKTTLTVSSGEFVSLIPRGLDLRYVYFLVQSQPYRERLESMVESATRSHARVLPSDVRKFQWAFPTLAEQEAIAAFLDRETAKIDALIAEQERLMGLLREKRQAAISHVVTKGLNPNAPMKPSRVEWLGEVPAHWQVGRIGTHSTKITNGYVGPTRDVLLDDGVRYLQSLHIKQNKIEFHTPYFVSEAWSLAHEKSILRAGDVLIVQTGDVGQTAVVTPEYAGCNCHALIIVSPTPQTLCGEWLSWVLNSHYGRQSLESIQTGALHPHLNCGDIKDVFVTLPSVEEQRQVVLALEERLSSFDELISESAHAVELLRERRSALISAAVTGQIDVSHLATAAA